ncbi:hypothetical protein DXG01_010311, partial [Tephrocybe rancida]
GECKVLVKLKKHNNIRDDERSLFIEWLRLDISCTLFRHGWDLDICLAMKMSWTDWPKFAYIHKLCLVNWPVDAVPPGQTDEKYDIKKKSNGVSQQCLTSSNAKWREDPESNDQTCIRIISWDAEDLELGPEDDFYGDIPLVSDLDGYSKTGDFDVSKKKRKGRSLKDKPSPTLYKSRKFLLKNVNFIDLDAPDGNPNPNPIPEPSSHAKRAHANDDEQEHTSHKKTRVDNKVPGPSKPKKTCKLTAVAGPSKQFEMTPEMIAAVARMVMAMQSGDDNADDST